VLLAKLFSLQQLAAGVGIDVKTATGEALKGEPETHTHHANAGEPFWVRQAPCRDSALP
jgi:hypothetical protein